MKVKLLFTPLLLVCQFSLSQNAEFLHGKIFNQNIPIKDVEVINYTTKSQTTTDEKGQFSIDAKTNDLLIFISKNYELKRLLVNQSLFNKDPLYVFLILKPEELQEVVVTKMKTIKLSKDKAYEQRKLQEIAIDRVNTRPQTGSDEMLGGVNLLPLISMVLGLIIEEKEPAKEPPPKVEFITLAKKICDREFYLEKLKLKPDEIDLFLQFCDADAKSKTLIEDNNVLSLMDFLSTKNTEFQKLTILEK